MFSFITRRLVYGVITLLALSVAAFTLMQMSGGGPLDRLKLNPRIQPEYLEQLTRFWGLDKPVWLQYWVWLTNFVTPTRATVVSASIYPALAGAGIFTIAAYFLRLRDPRWRRRRWIAVAVVWALTLWFVKGRFDFALDWGDSFRGDGAVWDNVMGAAGATFRLGFAALFISLAIGLPLGIYQATRQYAFFDQFGTFVSFLAFSVPNFILALGLQLLLALHLESWTGVTLFYVAGMTSPGYSELSFPARMGDVFQHLTLPALSVALVSIAVYARFQRAAMLEVLQSDFLRTAKAKGLHRRQIVFKHALRNALIPVVTLVSIEVAQIVGGTIIIENIFGWPGIGRLYVGAINAVDYPTVMAIVVAAGATLVVMNVIADILYGILDPRVRNE